MLQPRTLCFSLLISLSLIGTLTGCNRQDASESGNSGGGRGGPGGGRGEEGPAVVEFLSATAGSLDGSTTYTGTVEPQQQVGLKPQITAQLLNLTVEVGDRVNQGDIIAQLDDKLLQAAVQAAEAELAVREVELAQARTAIADGQTAIEQASVELQQAQVDADRLRSLAQKGAIAQQQAELAETSRQVAQQTFQSAQAQSQTQNQAIAAAQQRITAQAALVAQAVERLSYATLSAPVTGVVLSRSADSGDLVQAGEDIVTLGDIRDTQVVVQISDRDRSQVSIGQPVQVQIDAFPDRPFTGNIERISPVADPASRLIPVEILLNTSEALGSGLLARVSLSKRGASSIVVPESAVSLGSASGDSRSRQKTGQDLEQPDRRSVLENDSQPANNSLGATVFIVAPGENRGERPAVKAQPVKLGTASNGQVEIVSGLSPGQLYVSKSSQPLTDGQQVRRSLVSEF